MVIRGLVFDLDDTLFDEREYVRSGFSHVARLVGDSDDESRTLDAWLWNAFEAGFRGDTFDRLLEAFPDRADRFPIPMLINAYRTHPPAVKLAPGVEAMLDALLERGVRLALLTDGPIESQTAKATALGLDRWFEPIVLTASLGKCFAKPSAAGFEAIARDWGLPHAELGYVADNPEKDFAGPRRLGWLTIRLRRPAQLRFALEPSSEAFRPDVEVGDPSEVLVWTRSDP
jgi:putative hydrolase of the HAD superfamily